MDRVKLDKVIANRIDGLHQAVVAIQMGKSTGNKRVRIIDPKANR